MSRIFTFFYGAVAYLVFLVAILYGVGFISGFAVPKTIDDGAAFPLAEAIAVNLLLLTMFAVQHSAMARRWFKGWWLQYASASVERSTFVLLASLVLLLLFWQWRPMPQAVWSVGNPTLAAALLGFGLFGWFLVFASTFMINHFELFGLHQAVNQLVGRAMPPMRFKTPMLYKIVRHPIYLGFIIAFWSTPTMTAGHLLFSAVATAYLFLGIALEERDLIALFGDEYRRYRKRVAMIIPFLGRSS